MIKRNILIFSTLLLLLSGCSEYQKLLKSSDYKEKYKKAVLYYNDEQFVKAATLFEDLAPIYRGTSKAETISYYTAFCSYGMGSYIEGGYHFRNLIKTYPDSPFAEESLYMSAYCYYMQSPKPRLDQRSTAEAIAAYQLYINRYPNSTRVKKCNEYIDELQDKLVMKSFLSASNYFDRERYPSAIVALQNSLKDYPSSKHRESLMFMLLKSKFVLADLSVVSKQRERFNNAKEEYYSFVDEFPQSTYSNQTTAMLKEIDKYLKKFSSNK